MKRRRVRKYRRGHQNSLVKFLGIIGIMVIAVICGYLTARFAIAPLLGYDTEVLKLDFPSKLTALLEEKAEQSEAENVENAEETADSSGEGYALQYGLFSTKDRAEALVSKLEKDGIDTEIKEVDGQYKVISSLFTTKDAALDALAEVKTEAVTDVFITVID